MGNPEVCSRDFFGFLHFPLGDCFCTKNKWFFKLYKLSHRQPHLINYSGPSQTFSPESGFLLLKYEVTVRYACWVCLSITLQFNLIKNYWQHIKWSYLQFVRQRSENFWYGIRTYANLTYQGIDNQTISQLEVWSVVLIDSQISIYCSWQFWPYMLISFLYLNEIQVLSAWEDLCPIT